MSGAGDLMRSVHLADCVAWLRAHEWPLFDACVTDPPYHLTSIVQRFGGADAAPARKGRGAGATGAYARASRGFMGKQWDGGDVAFKPETWAAVFARLKPGAHLVAFSGTRTYHRMACAIEDAGFEIRDQLAWAYGTGFPKSHDISKAIDKAAGHWRGRAGAVTIEQQVAKGREYERSDKGDAITAAAAAWQGWGTALKPSWEPICLARKPISEASVAANVRKWGTGALNIDGCRVDAEKLTGWAGAGAGGDTWNESNMGLGKDGDPRPVLGRWPANLCHDGSAEVEALFPDDGAPSTARTGKRTGILGEFSGQDQVVMGHNDAGGSAARFFYSAKAGPLARLGSAHATVKPVDLMRWLVRMVTPPRTPDGLPGHVLDPFAGSGTTGIAAMAEAMACTMIDIEADHVADIERKFALLRGDLAGHIAQHVNRRRPAPIEGTPLFGGEAA